jgi:glutamyl-tRNA synthetase
MAWQPLEAEIAFKALAALNNIKVGEVMMPLRIMLVGGKFGPGVFEIACLLSKPEVAHRISTVVNQLS